MRKILTIIFALVLFVLAILIQSELAKIVLHFSFKLCFYEIDKKQIKINTNLRKTHSLAHKYRNFKKN